MQPLIYTIFLPLENPKFVSDEVPGHDAQGCHGGRDTGPGFDLDAAHWPDDNHEKTSDGSIQDESNDADHDELAKFFSCFFVVRFFECPNLVPNEAVRYGKGERNDLEDNIGNPSRCPREKDQEIQDADVNGEVRRANASKFCDLEDHSDIF